MALIDYGANATPTLTNVQQIAQPPSQGQVSMASQTPPPPTLTPAQMFAQPGTSGTFSTGSKTSQPGQVNQTIPAAEPVAAFNNGFTYPLHTQGNKIFDAKGQQVKLVSTALGGFDGGAPFGIWATGHSIPAILDGIKNAGFNSIRLPISVSEFIDPGYHENDGNLAVNHPELVGAQPINVLDYFLDQAAQRGLGVVLDMHGMRPGDYTPSQWYSTEHPGDSTGNVINGLNDPTNHYNGQVNEADFTKVWTLLGQRYANHPGVIGFDLLNEPHGGKITWGTGDTNTDWRLAAERIGGALQQVAPNKLTVVEGIDAKQGVGDAWWGGNLSGVGANPVRLPNVVYSPHDYGSSVYGQWWLNDPTATEALWDREWGYIAKNNIAPVWIGEFGTRNFDPNTTDGKWIRHLLDYSQANGISWSYWIWHDASSGDTGGLTNSADGQPERPDATKIQLLQQYMGSPQADPTFGNGQMGTRSGYTPQYAPFDDTRPGFPAIPSLTAFGGAQGTINQATQALQGAGAVVADTVSAAAHAAQLGLQTASGDFLSSAQGHSAQTQPSVAPPTQAPAPAIGATTGASLGTPIPLAMATTPPPATTPPAAGAGGFPTTVTLPISFGSMGNIPQPQNPFQGVFQQSLNDRIAKGLGELPKLPGQ